MSTTGYPRRPSSASAEDLPVPDIPVTKTLVTRQRYRVYGDVAAVCPVFRGMYLGPDRFQLRAIGERQGCQGQDGIARYPCDQERRLHRDRAERGDDEHQQVESHERSRGDYPLDSRRSRPLSNSSPAPSSHGSGVR